MPWKVYKDGDKFCVHKENDGQMGALVPGGCHPTEAQADRHLRALYAAEGKKEIEDVVKEVADVYSDTTHNLEETLISIAQASTLEGVQAVLDEFNSREKVDTDTPDTPAVPDEDEAKEAMAESIFERVLTRLKGVFGARMQPEQDNDDGMMIWKEEDGTYRWLARYSNNLRDDDNPPEIISSESHKKYCELVDSGVEPLPELLIWHTKEWKIGQADWVAYDDGSGFALAGGHFTRGLEEVAEALSKQKDIANSHGMPVQKIKRAVDDPTVIVEHVTSEISILPRWSAANKRTGFVVLTTQKEELMIPTEKRKKLAEWGLSDEQIARIEDMNQKEAEAAVSAGVERKEADQVEQPVATEVEPEPAPAVTEQPAAEPVSEPPVQAETPVTPAITQDDIRNAVSEAVAAVLAPITARLDAIDGEIKAVKEQDAIAGTPLASIAALIGARANSPIGSPETQLDGRSKLAKQGPAEETSKEAADGRTLVPFINSLLAAKQ